MKTVFEFPFVSCEEHPGQQRAYVVCEHVRFGEREAVHIIDATDEQPGEVLCETCAEDPPDKPLLICATHVEELLRAQLRKRLNS